MGQGSGLGGAGQRGLWGRSGGGPGDEPWGVTPPGGKQDWGRGEMHNGVSKRVWGSRGMGAGMWMWMRSGVL